MKEFYINHVRFWVGDGITEWEADTSDEAIKDCSISVWGREVNSTLDTIYIKGVIVKRMFEKVTCNNWRRKHGLKMIKRDRAWKNW